MIRTLLIFLLLTTPVLSQKDQVEPIRAKITKAETAYTTDLVKIHSDITKWYDQREKEARRKGDTHTINNIKESRKLLETGITPKNAPLHLKKRLETISELLDASYTAAIREALTSNLDDLANSLEAKRTEIKKEQTNDIFKLVAKMTKNHVIDGDFEEQIKGKPLNSPNWTHNNSYIVKNWTKEPWPSGEQCLQTGNDKVEQTIKDLEPGLKYVLTFYTSTYATPTAPDQWAAATLKITIDKEQVTHTHPASGSPTKYLEPGIDFPWVPITLIFEATAPETQLTIETKGNRPTLIDNIKVTQLN